VSETPEQPTTTRRGFLDWVIYVCSTISGAALVLPALVYLFPATRSGPAKAREEAGDADSWRAWEARKIALAGKPVLVVKKDKDFVAYTAICPHLGCLVEFSDKDKTIVCPCHAATFDLEGKVVAGPPPRPLASYTVSVVQGKVYVSL
jgi:cytochrome b6-f complex iron-sulfur subunit